MKEIILTKGFVAKVSLEDFDYLQQFIWCVIGEDRDGIPHYYANRKCDNILVRMHHVVIQRMGLTVPIGYEPDHTDRNGLNNLRTNLRIVTASENCHNKRLYRNNTSGIKGVGYHAGTNQYQVRISIRGTRYSLGYFNTLIEAEIARINGEIQFGVRGYARLD